MGFGGSCFPKDLRALDHTARSLGLDLLVIQAAIAANARQKQFIPDKILDRFKGRLDGRKIAVWGLAFKANTDDMRESPAIPLIEMLLDNRALVSAYDPQAVENARKVFGDRIHYATDDYEAATDADALVIATEWNEFRRPDLERLKALMKSPIVFDGRNLFDPVRMRSMGFEYYAVGRA
jgi:UDPglucose 6-dehydrogenase